MARGQLKDVLFDTQEQGNDLLYKVARDAGDGGLEVTVYDPDDNEATLYSARTGGGTLANPITSDSGTGEYDCFLDPGSYRVVFSRDGVVEDERWVQILDATDVVSRLDAVESGRLFVEDFGASPSASAAANTTAINAALTALKALPNGVLVFGWGDYQHDGTLNADTAGAAVHGLTLEGQGPLATSLTYTGTGTQLSIRRSISCKLKGIRFLAESLGASGRTIDMRGEAGVSDSSINLIEWCFLDGGDDGIGLDLNRCTASKVHITRFKDFKYQVSGVDTPGQFSGPHLFDTCYMERARTAAFRNPDLLWKLLVVTCEPLYVSDAVRPAGAILVESGFAIRSGLDVDTCYFADATPDNAATGTWIVLRGGYATIHGSLFETGERFIQTVGAFAGLKVVDNDWYRNGEHVACLDLGTPPTQFTYEDNRNHGSVGSEIVGSWDRKTSRVQTDSDAWVGMSGSLGGAWVNYGGAFQVAQYRRFPDGTVRFRGLIKSGAVPLTIFTLPAGFRPVADGIFHVLTNTGPGRIDIVASNGHMDIASGGSGFVSLNTIQFEAA